MFKSIELEQAVKLLLQDVTIQTQTQCLPLAQALGRVLAADVHAALDNPPFDRSPLDGYAVHHTSIQTASRELPALLEVIDEICAGEVSAKAVEQGQAVRIMTGAMMPKGATCVVRQEDTNCGTAQVEIYISCGESQNYCFAGEDIRRGQLLMQKGARLNYIHIGILASMGIEEVAVFCPVKVGILATGSELCALGKPLEQGKIYNTNLYLLAARIQQLGCEPVLVQEVGDEVPLVAAALREQLAKVDLMLTTGAVSVGKKDIMPEVLDALGAQKVFWRVNLKPGTPALYATVQGKQVLCLSGNPFAAITTFELLARPVLAKICSDATLSLQRMEGTMVDSFAKKSMGRRFIRATCHQGRVTLPKGGHASGMLASMLGCNCLLDIPAGNEGLFVGDKVQVVLL